MKTKMTHQDILVGSLAVKESFAPIKLKPCDIEGASINNSKKSGKTMKKGDTSLTIDNNNTLIRVNVSNRAWLHYYNNYLRDSGTISEDEWRKMRRVIEKR